MHSSCKIVQSGYTVLNKIDTIANYRYFSNGSAQINKVATRVKNRKKKTIECHIFLNCVQEAPEMQFRKVDLHTCSS